MKDGDGMVGVVEGVGEVEEIDQSYKSASFFVEKTTGEKAE